MNEVTEEQPTSETLSTLTENDSEKNPAAVILGRLGGIKGGPARAKKLSKERRCEIAIKAAEARWKCKTEKRFSVEDIDRLIKEREQQIAGLQIVVDRLNAARGYIQGRME